MKSQSRHSYTPQPWQTQTMHLAFKEICEGEQPWIALGNFMNYWFCYAKDRREALVVEPIQEALADTYVQRWAAFCAASVEFLCKKYTVPCPEWVHDPKYILPEPWYHLPRYDVPIQVYASLVASTPEEFRKRNMYVDDNVYDNKWELMERWQEKIEQAKRLSQKERREYWKTGKMPVR